LSLGSEAKPFSLYLTGFCNCLHMQKAKKSSPGPTLRPVPCQPGEWVLVAGRLGMTSGSPAFQGRGQSGISPRPLVYPSALGTLLHLPSPGWVLFSGMSQKWQPEGAAPSKAWHTNGCRSTASVPSLGPLAICATQQRRRQGHTTLCHLCLSQAHHRGPILLICLGCFLL
jgi:hypothetical protein